MEVRKLHTIDEILALPEGKRAELIDGVWFDMSAPTREHQDISMGISNSIYNYIRENKGECKVYAAPFAVYLSNDDHNYVEPDVIIVCDEKKLDDKGCHGAPDMIVEIVSESSIQNDYMRKMFKYGESGVRLYWIVDPLRQSVRTYDFVNEMTYDFSFEDKVPVEIFDSLQIRVSDYLT